MIQPIQIGSRRELFWDDFLIERTSTAFRQHKPEDRGIAMTCDAPWEGSGCGYPVVMRDKGIIRLYYKAGQFNINPESKRGDPLTGPIVVCCAESYDDGRTFTRPDYGIYDYPGGSSNNIILMAGGFTKETDNFAVFKDTNPDCPPAERFKAVADNGPVAEGSHDRILSWYASPDGVHFTPVGELLRGGWFDSMNCAFWDRHTRQYFLYMRDWPEGYSRTRDGVGTKKRDIRYAVSRDFRNWSEPQRVDFGVDDDVELYTNGIKPYGRADHVFLGLPTRYVEREGWSPSFDHLPNPEHRRIRSSLSMRYGTALTDCVLITSRDGVHFRRWDEAFMTGGIEREHNWIYGDCYCSWGFVETPSDLPDYAPDELSFYAFENLWQTTSVLHRYAIRKDGFISCHAGLKPCELLTKPLIFAGSRLLVNFATSAVGSIRVDLLDEAGQLLPDYQGYPIFGDNLDRPIVFRHGTDVSALAGKPVRLRLTMSNADIFSFQFLA